MLAAVQLLLGQVLVPSYMVLPLDQATNQSSSTGNIDPFRVKYNYKP